MSKREARESRESTRKDSEKRKLIRVNSRHSRAGLLFPLLFVSIRVSSWLLSFLIRWHFGQHRRLQHSLFFFFTRVQWQSAGGDEPCGDEDDQVAFDMLIDIGTKEAPNQRNVANDRRFIFCPLHILPHQPAQHYCLPVPHADIRCHLTRAEHRLV